jgi:hypothetical protein
MQGSTEAVEVEVCKVVVGQLGRQDGVAGEGRDHFQPAGQSRYQHRSAIHWRERAVRGRQQYSQEGMVTHPDSVPRPPRKRRGRSVGSLGQPATRSRWPTGT